MGLFVLMGFVALLFVSLQAANLGNFSFNAKTYELNANFDNIGGLKPRAPVKSAGVVVGRVKAINFDPTTFQAHVLLNIDSAYQFPEDSSAQILTAGLLGEQYVGISAGGADGNMQPGARFEQTQSAEALEHPISQFMLQFAEKGSSDGK